MKLEHLLQAFKVNNINAELKEMNKQEERTGVIQFTNGIFASYLLDDEEIIIALKIFCNCITTDKLTAQAQLDYTIKVIDILQKVIMLLCNITQKECNMILESLGLFDNTFKIGKQIQHLEHVYRIETLNGLLCLSIEEIELLKD